MEHIHSIIIIKKGNTYLNYFDKNWGMYLFPNIKGNNIETIKKTYNTNKVKFLFEKTHNKYSISNNKIKTYHHYFYEIDDEIKGEYFTLNELLGKPKERKYNSDIINFIKSYYDDIIDGQKTKNI